MILLKLYLFFAIRKCIQIQCAAHTFSPHTYERTYPHTYSRTTKQCIHESTRSLFCYVHTYSLGWFCDRSKLTCLLANCHSSPFAWNWNLVDFFHVFLEFILQILILAWISCYFKNVLKLFSRKIAVISWFAYYIDFTF